MRTKLIYKHYFLKTQYDKESFILFKNMNIPVSIIFEK